MIVEIKVSGTNASGRPVHPCTFVYTDIPGKSFDYFAYKATSLYMKMRPEVVRSRWEVANGPTGDTE